MGQNMSLEEKVFACTEKGDNENIRRLKANGAGLEWKDAKGRTPLMYACNHGELHETAKTLLELGANVNAFRPRQGGGTPLHHAARQGQEQNARLLLAYNANPFIINDEKETAHDIARRAGYVGVVRAIEQKIALFMGPMREQTGNAPGFLQQIVSQFIFTNVFVVVIPHRPDLNSPPTFILLVYPSDRVASPKYRVVMDYAQLTVKKPDTPDTALEVVDTATKTKFKLLVAPNEKGQVNRLYNACRGLVPVGSSTPPPGPTPAPFPPIPANYLPQNAGSSTPPSNRPTASGTPAANNLGQEKVAESEDEALAMAIAASLETAKQEPGAAASHDRYGGWADESRSDYGGWGGESRPAATPSRTPPRAEGPAAASAAAYTPAPLPSRTETRPKPGAANLPGAAASALPPIPNRGQRGGSSSELGGWAVVEEGPGGWGGEGLAPASAPPLPSNDGGASYNYQLGGSSQAHHGATYDYNPPAAGGSSAPEASSSGMGASYTVVGQEAGGGVNYGYQPEGGRIAYPSVDRTPAQYPKISAEDLGKPNLGGAGASSLRKAGDPTCAVCLDQPAEGVCVPCGHVAGCMECLREIKAKGMGCPICRTPIKEVVKIYMPN